jgi:hypothetical protein
MSADVKIWYRGASLATTPAVLKEALCSKEPGFIWER